VGPDGPGLCATDPVEVPLTAASNLLASFARWVWTNVLLPSLSEALSALVKAIAARLSAWAGARLVQGGAA